MIRPGKMRCLITIQRAALAPDQYGREVAAWQDVATLRAELVEDRRADAAEATPGTDGKRPVTFRARMLGGVGVADRVIWRGGAFNIVSVAEFPAVRAMELQCEGEG